MCSTSAPASGSRADRFAAAARGYHEGMSVEQHRKGTKVTWKWGNGTAEGKVAESFTDRVTRTIEGKEITRDADADNPAYLVEQEDGSRALKSHSELSDS